MRTLIAGALWIGMAAAAPAQLLINGAGATFPYPIYAKWFDEFHKINPKAQINYQSQGSRRRHPPASGRHRGFWGVG